MSILSKPKTPLRKTNPKIDNWFKQQEFWILVSAVTGFFVFGVALGGAIVLVLFDKLVTYGY
jgi:uncharacterized membrane protein YraQ (UPF0718 family)